MSFVVVTVQTVADRVLEAHDQFAVVSGRQMPCNERERVRKVKLRFVRRIDSSTRGTLAHNRGNCNHAVSCEPLSARLDTSACRAAEPLGHMPCEPVILDGE
jgi:hypothetical protein